MYDASSEKEVITMEIMEEAIPLDLPEAPCSDTAMNSSDLCSCVAAGNCKWDPSANGCYIIFCDGHVIDQPGWYKAANDTTVTQPCQAG
jgi:hypothetical protein